MKELRTRFGELCGGLAIIVGASVLGLILGLVMNHLAPGGP